MLARQRESENLSIAIDRNPLVTPHLHGGQVAHL
jgi:hypothetical protein